MRGGNQYGIGERFRAALQGDNVRLVMPRRFPALNPGVGIDTGGLADTDIVIQWRAGELVRQRRQ